MTDQDGYAFEVENVRTYEAGPGVTALYNIDPLSGERRQVGGNLQPITDTYQGVHVSGDSLRAAVRAAARRFDAEAAWDDADEPQEPTRQAEEPPVESGATETTRTVRADPNRKPCSGEARDPMSPGLVADHAVARQSGARTTG